MPTFYHIHRGLEPSTLEKEFVTIDEDENSILFVAKKNSIHHNIEKNVSKQYGGYREYTITFPSSLYSKSFYPRTPKVIRITGIYRKIM